MTSQRTSFRALGDTSRDRDRLDGRATGRPRGHGRPPAAGARLCCWWAAVATLAIGCSDSVSAIGAETHDAAQTPGASNEAAPTTHEPEAGQAAEATDVAHGPAVDAMRVADADAPDAASTGVSDGAHDATTDEDELQQLLMTYRSFRPLSAAPVDISLDIFALCRLPTPAEQNFADSVHGRHALRNWANPAAARGIDATTLVRFDEGSAIVKEKFVIAADGQPTLAALGVMLKRSAGSDRAAGDWEFAYWDAANGLQRDTTGACSGCHATPTATDFVFLDASWRRTTAP